MENNKSLVWPQGLLLALIALSGSLGIALILPLSLKHSETESTNNINLNDIEVKAGTQQRLSKFKAAMLKTWQQEAKTKGLSYPVPVKFQGLIVNQAKLSPNQKVIALTFDDGPWPGYTAQVLDILKKNNIKATFFVVGQMLKNYPDLGKQIVAEGHVIGNHTWHHWYHFFNPKAAAFEIDRTSELIYQVTGAKANLFRPPGGKLHNGLVNYARGKKYTVVMWSADSLDYSRSSAPILSNRVLKQSKPGGIVLMHDGGGNRSQTVNALPQIISKLREQGYRFVTVPELLELQEKEQKLAAKTKK